MKHTFAMVLLCGAFISSHGQQTEIFSQKRNEVNIGSFNAFELNANPNLGIGYKRTVKNGAWRIGTGLSYYTNSYEYQTSTNKYKGYSISPRIGYEFHQNYNRLQLLYGVDLSTSFSDSQEERIYENDENYNFEQTSGYSVGIRPLLGLKVYLSKMVSITAETYLYINYTESTTVDTYGNNSNTYTTSGMRVGLAPLGVFSVNLHF